MFFLFFFGWVVVDGGIVGCYFLGFNIDVLLMVASYVIYVWVSMLLVGVGGMVVLGRVYSCWTSE